MNHALSRLRRPSHRPDPSRQLEGEPSFSVISGANPQLPGRAVPSYASSSNPIRFAEKTLPPGAVYSHHVEANEAERDRDELDRTLQTSREEAEIENLLRESRLEEEEANAERQRELEAEESALLESRRINEEQESAVQIAQYEEEQALQKAIEESRLEAVRAVKGKARLSPSQIEGDEEDEDLNRVIEMSQRQHNQEQRNPQDMRGQGGPSRPPLPPDPPVEMPASPARPKRSPPAPPTRPSVHVVNQGSDDGYGDAPPSYDQASITPISDAEVQRSVADTENKRLCFYPPVGPDMVEGSMRIVVPNMLFASRVRRVSDDYFPMTSRDLDPASLPPPSAEGLPKRPRRPLPPLPTDQQEESSAPNSSSSNTFNSRQSLLSNEAASEPTTDSSNAAMDGDHDQEDYQGEQPNNLNEPGALQEDGHSAEQQSLQSESPAPTPDVDQNSHHRYQLSSEHTDSSDGHESESSRVSRHDYAQTEMDESGMPRALSPEPMQDEPSYDTDQSGGSFESAASDTDIEENSSRMTETAQDINTNISFGFNPLSSPTQHLDWQGRFPDVVLLSRYSASTEEPEEHTGFEKEDYRTFAFEAPTWRELIAYLMWHGNSLFEPAPRDMKEARSASLRVSLIVEFVKNIQKPVTCFVRLQVHLLRNTSDAQSASEGVSLSRLSLSSRASHEASISRSASSNNRNSMEVSPTHLVLAFPKPFHSLPLTLSTIGSYLHNARKAAMAAKNNDTLAIDSGQPKFTSSNAFLLDLARGIELCSKSGAKEPEDNRIESLMDRLRRKRHRIKGTFKELHRRSRRQKERRRGRGRQDSAQSHLESVPQDTDYHITPYRESLQ